MWKPKKTSEKLLLGVVVFLSFVVVGIAAKPPEKKTVDHQIVCNYSVEHPDFRRSMGTLLGPPLVGGNQTVELLNGEETFPSMLDAIRNAKKTITFETYIYWSGKVGKAFAEALAERARAGVRVHVLLDWVGSGKMDKSNLEMMEQAGVEVERYNPLRWYSVRRFNNRTHRKIMVVDGKTGFTGGLGVADHWLGDGDSPEEWRDTHFKIEGPVVGQMQAAFLDNWIQSTSRVLHGPDYFPHIETSGGQDAQVIRSSPDDGSESVRLMYLFSIAAARKSIFISNAYFIPDDRAMQAFVAARKRGVRVQIILPGPILDTETTRMASRARWGPLLQAGVEIYQFQPAMYHCKVMIVDGVWVSVGSTNFDNRSFQLNDEANLNVFDQKLASQLIETFQEDLKKSKRVTFEQWQNRPLSEKVKDRLANVIGKQL